MLIEQTIELQLRGPGPPGRTYTGTPITGYFHYKTKISNENVQVDYYLLLKCSKKQCTLYFPLSGPNHLQLKFNTRMKDVKRILDLHCK